MCTFQQRATGAARVHMRPPIEFSTRSTDIDLSRGPRGRHSTSSSISRARTHDCGLARSNSSSSCFRSAASKVRLQFDRSAGTLSIGVVSTDSQTEHKSAAPFHSRSPMRSTRQAPQPPTVLMPQNLMIPVDPYDERLVHLLEACEVASSSNTSPIINQRISRLQEPPATQTCDCSSLTTSALGTAGVTAASDVGQCTQKISPTQHTSAPMASMALSRPRSATAPLRVPSYVGYTKHELTPDPMSSPWLCRPTTASLLHSGLTAKMFEFDVANATNVWQRNLREPIEGRPSQRLAGRPLTAAEKERVNARHRLWTGHSRHKAVKKRAPDSYAGHAAMNESMKRLLAAPRRGEVVYANGMVNWLGGLRDKPSRPAPKAYSHFKLLEIKQASAGRSDDAPRDAGSLLVHQPRPKSAPANGKPEEPPRHVESELVARSASSSELRNVLAHYQDSLSALRRGREGGDTW